MGFSFRGRSAPARCIRHLISVRPDDMTGCGSPKVLRGRKFKETRSTVYLQQVLSAILTGCILMTLLVGAGQFERPPPCAQGSFRHGSKLARFQVLRFQGDTANALQVVERSGSQRLPAATFLSTAVQWGRHEAGDGVGRPRWRLRQRHCASAPTSFLIGETQRGPRCGPSLAIRGHLALQRRGEESDEVGAGRLAVDS